MENKMRNFVFNQYENKFQSIEEYNEYIKEAFENDPFFDIRHDYYNEIMEGLMEEEKANIDGIEDVE